MVGQPRVIGQSAELPDTSSYKLHSILGINRGQDRHIRSTVKALTAFSVVEPYSAMKGSTRHLCKQLVP